MVTITSLIVIASLFAAVSATSPATSSIRVLDIYFFGFICRLFMTFLIHIYHHKALLQQENAKEANQTPEGVSHSMNKLVLGDSVKSVEDNYGKHPVGGAGARLSVSPIDPGQQKQAWLSQSHPSSPPKRTRSSVITNIGFYFGLLIDFAFVGTFFGVIYMLQNEFIDDFNR